MIYNEHLLVNIIKFMVKNILTKMIYANTSVLK